MLERQTILVQLSMACSPNCDSARSSAESRMARSTARPLRSCLRKQYTSPAARETEAPCPGVDRLGPIFVRCADARR